MKSLLTVTGVIVLVSALFCTVVQAQKTSAAHDKNIDFSNYKTFAFDKAGARNPFVNKMIVAAIERELLTRLQLGTCCGAMWTLGSHIGPW